jgi:putative DNA primase/helicase
MPKPSKADLTQSASGDVLRGQGHPYIPLLGDDPAFGASCGTLAGWQDGMRGPFAESSYLTFVASLAFGAIFLEPLGAEGGTFNLVGETTTFKTTTARVGQSVFGRADANDLASLDVTKRGREELCASHRDSLLVLDETARLGKSFSVPDFQEFLYCVASGQGKIRSAAVTKNSLLANVSWRVFALLTSEDLIDSTKLKSGATLRFAQILVFGADRGGVFDRTGQMGSDLQSREIELAGQVRDCIGANYGVAGPAFVKAFVENRQILVKRAKALVEKFMNHAGVKGDAQHERFAHKFGVAYAAGVIAAEQGIAPWDSKHVARCVYTLYRLARRAMGGAEEQNPAVLNRIAEAIRGDQFPLVQRGEALPSCKEPIWGVCRDIGDERVFAFPFSKLRRLAGTRGAAVELLDYWAQIGLLLLSPEGNKTWQARVPGWSDKRQRLVCIKERVLFNF